MERHLQSPWCLSHISINNAKKVQLRHFNLNFTAQHPSRYKLIKTCFQSILKSLLIFANNVSLLLLFIILWFSILSTIYYNFILELIFILCRISFIFILSLSILLSIIFTTKFYTIHFLDLFIVLFYCYLFIWLHFKLSK